MDSSSDEELFPIVNDHANFDVESIFLYNDPLLMSGVLRAVVEESLEKVIQMIESGKSVNLNDNNGNTPLHIAVIKNNIKILEYLLSREDIVVNVRNFRGETPLYYAVKMGRLEVVKTLIHAGANVNLPNYDDVTPLHVSVSHPDIAHFLVLNGAKIDAIDYSGDTALHDATAEGCLETICMLLYYNADANIPGGNNLTPFMKAVTSGNVEAQLVLIEYVYDFNLTTDEPITTLGLALAHDSPYVEEIIKRGADVNLYNDNLICAFSICLRIPNSKNFKSVWEKLRYNKIKNSINLYLLFEHLVSDDVEKYIQVIIESDNIKTAVESFTCNDNYFLFINKFAKLGLKLKQLTELTCRLLEYGYRTTSYDIYGIFSEYGYCELTKILLYMDNDCRKGWLPFMIVPRLIFDINYQLLNKINDVLEFHEKDVQQLLEYFVCPRFIGALMRRFRDDEHVKEILENVSSVPSLTELARNAARAHILQSFSITSTCQFYTIVNHLNIASVYKQILTFEKKLYEHCLITKRNSTNYIHRLSR